MPELPEVETIKNELSPWVVGRSFTEINILDARLVCGGSVEEVRRGLIGQKVERLERRGKYLIFHLSSGRSLIMHLRMTGSLLLNPKDVDVFSDRRRLGKMWLVDDAGVVVCKLGPEPLDESFTPDILEQRLSRHRIPVKAALLDQCIVAGIGPTKSSLLLAFTLSEKQTICRPRKSELYIIASVEFLWQPSATGAPAWIPTSAPRASWALPISILRLLIREAKPALFAAVPSSGVWCRTVAPTSAPDASL